MPREIATGAVREAVTAGQAAVLPAVLPAAALPAANSGSSLQQMLLSALHSRCCCQRCTRACRDEGLATQPEDAVSTQAFAMPIRHKHANSLRVAI